jgi:hypothetical protein
MLIVVILNYLIKEIKMSLLANSPAPAALPCPLPYKKPCLVDLEEVLQVLKREGAETNLVLSVKEMELYS